jgi:hypothetical protein
LPRLQVAGGIIFEIRVIAPQPVLTNPVGAREEVGNEDAGAVPASSPDDFAPCHGIHSSQMGTIGQTAVDPTGIQSGVIGGGQIGAYQVWKQQRGCFRDIFGFYLPAVLVYTSIERSQFSPLVG